MNKNIFITSIAFICFAITIIGCKKTTTEPTPTTSTAATTPRPGDADGVLATVNVDATTTAAGITIPLTIGEAVAAFGSTSANFLAGTYVDAGTVSCNTQALTKQTGNSYLYQPTGSSATGIDFSSGVNWNVSGAGSIPAITKSLGVVMPTMPTVSSSKTVTKGSAYTMNINSISHADSIIFIIASGSVTLQKTLPGTATSCTFTASETGTLAKSTTALIQVDPFNYTSEIIGGKKIYYVNESSYNLIGAKVE